MLTGSLSGAHRPDRLVVGGGPANAVATLFDSLTAALQARRSTVDPPTVVWAGLGGRAGGPGASEQITEVSGREVFP